MARSRGHAYAPYECYGAGSNPVGSGSADYIGGCPHGSCSSTGTPDRHLPVVTVKWEPMNGFVNSDHDGYVVRVRLDPEARNLEYFQNLSGNGDYSPVTVLDGTGVFAEFFLPRYVDLATPGGGAPDLGQVGLTFGAGDGGELINGAANLTALDGTDRFTLQEFARDRMVLAAGFGHEIEVATYRGFYELDGRDRVEEGPASKTLTVRGTDETCDVLDGVTANPTQWQTSLSNALKCGQSSAAGLAAGGLAGAGQETLDRLQDFTGTEVCKDILTATPSHLTFDHPGVRAGWKIAWIISMALIPILLFWEALRMSWGVWLGENQISGAVRNLAPRLLLGIVLATGSLLLCQVLIMFAGHVTCYVGQATDVDSLGRDRLGIQGNVPKRMGIRGPWCRCCRGRIGWSFVGAWGYSDRHCCYRHGGVRRFGGDLLGRCSPAAADGDTDTGNRRVDDAGAGCVSSWCCRLPPQGGPGGGCL